MTNGERPTSEGPQRRIAALRDSIKAIRETQMNPNSVASLYRNAFIVAQDVMGLDPLAATAFAISFGTGVITDSRSPLSGAKKTYEELPGATPDMEAVAKYISAQFVLYPWERSDQGMLFALREKLEEADADPSYLSHVSTAAYELAHAICPLDLKDEFAASQGIDENQLTVESFTEAAQQIPSGEDFVFDDSSVPFLKETGEWAHKRFDTILDNIATGNIPN